MEEWTRAEIGVGAAMAIGSQEEKGYSALLVIKVRVRKTETIEEEEIKPLIEKKSGSISVISARLTRKKPSPIRFIRRVNKPEVIDLEFW